MVMWFFFLRKRSAGRGEKAGSLHLCNNVMMIGGKKCMRGVAERRACWNTPIRSAWEKKVTMKLGSYPLEHATSCSLGILLASHLRGN